MATTEAQDNVQRRQQIPHLSVRGTNYEIGYSIGRTFKGLIDEFFSQYTDFNQETLPAYNSEEGKKIYDATLAVCQQRFPQYVQELQGTADGAKIPFHHLFLLHIEGLILAYDPEDDDTNGNAGTRKPPSDDSGCAGCTTVIANGKDIFLGHTEDALKEITNNFYIVSAEVLAEDGVTLLEKFTSLCYPGQLAGGTMGFNTHGIVHSMNSIFPKETFSDRSPHLFITRALLAAKNMKDVIEVLKDEGTGTSDGFSINIVFSKGIRGESNDPPAVYNIEISPNHSGKPESELFVEEVPRGDCYSHCNQYLRCKVAEKMWFTSSSSERHETIKKFPTPYSHDTVKEILSSEVPFPEDKVKYSIFKRALRPEDHYATIAVGIFDVSARQWNLYTHPPKTSSPVLSIPMVFLDLN